jgi:hypothetical protein
MSEPVGADLPEARDGEGQLSKDALRSPERQAGDAPGLNGVRYGSSISAFEFQLAPGFVEHYRDRIR